MTRRFLSDILPRELRSEIFASAGELFIQKTKINFVRDMGMPRTTMEQRNHLIAIAEKCLSYLKPFMLEDEREKITETLRNAIDGYLTGLPLTVQVPVGEIPLENEMGSRIKIGECVKQREHVQAIRHGEVFKRKEFSSYHASPRDETPLTREALQNPFFPQKECLRMPQGFNLNGLMAYSIDQVMQMLYPNKWKQNIFDPAFSAFGNWLISCKQACNIGTSNEKPATFLLLIKRSNAFELFLMSYQNAAELAKLSLEVSKENWWLLLPNADLAWKGPTLYDKRELLNHPAVVKLFVEMQVFTGQVELFEQLFWKKALEEWLSNHPEPEIVRHYFEEYVQRNGKEQTYATSSAKKIFHHNL